MKIYSPAFKNEENIPEKYTCDGENINPPLFIEEVPSEAKSLALIVDDPDSPSGTWIHWTLWNISPTIKEIRDNSVPVGTIEGVTSFQNVGYGGPCPHKGVHRYFFKLYALDYSPELSAGSDIKSLEAAISNHILAEANFYGLYKRK